MSRITVWFSCGAASAVAAKMAIEYFRPLAVDVVCCDTRPSEHPDNYRFSQECEKWFGQKIIYIRNPKFQTVDDTFGSYMSGIKGAVCTTQLKKFPRLDYQRPDDIHIFGYTLDEIKRIVDFKNRNPDLRLFFVLPAFGITKSDCYQLIKNAGIKLPVMYELGFDNNNCPGCVKASSPWYWSMVRKNFPDVFKRRCEQSRAIGARLVEISRHKRIFLDELPDREFKKRKNRENLSCGPECGVPQVI